MLGCHLSFFNIIKEEAYLNRRAKKGWLVTGKAGCFYRFKRHTQPLKIIVDLAESETTITDNDYFHPLFTKKMRRPQITVLYYYTDNPELIEMDIQRDDFVTLHYFEALGDRLLTTFNVLASLWIMLLAFSIFSRKTHLNNPYGGVLFFLFMGIFIWVFLTDASLKKQGKILQLKTGDFSASPTIRYIIAITPSQQEKLALIEKELGYLGNWVYRHQNKGTSYYQLYSATNEEILFHDISSYLNSDDQVQVISPAFLFPIGWG